MSEHSDLENWLLLHFFASRFKWRSGMEETGGIGGVLTVTPYSDSSAAVPANLLWVLATHRGCTTFDLRLDNTHCVLGNMQKTIKRLPDSCLKFLDGRFGFRAFIFKRSTPTQEWCGFGSHREFSTFFYLWFLLKRVSESCTSSTTSQYWMFPVESFLDGRILSTCTNCSLQSSPFFSLRDVKNDGKLF